MGTRNCWDFEELPHPCYSEKWHGKRVKCRNSQTKVKLVNQMYITVHVQYQMYITVHVQSQLSTSHPIMKRTWQIAHNNLLSFALADFAQDGPRGPGAERAEGDAGKGRRRHSHAAGHRLGQPADGRRKDPGMSINQCLCLQCGNYFDKLIVKNKDHVYICAYQMHLPSMVWGQTPFDNIHCSHRTRTTSTRR